VNLRWRSRPSARCIRVRVIWCCGVKVPGMSADDERKLTAAMRLAEACGFRFTQVTPGAAWWGERDTAQWKTSSFLVGSPGTAMRPDPAKV
jgi:hypothetical protein